MNITVINNGKIYNCSNVRSVSIRDGYIRLLYNEYEIGKHYNQIIMKGDEVCFGGKKYLVTTDNIESIVSKLNIHAHNHEIIEGLGNLK